MESLIASPNVTASATAVTTAKSLRRLYFIRTTFSIIWVILVSVFAKSNTTIANILFVIYPAWDVFATFLDIKANPQQVSKTPQYVNIVFGILTTIGVVLALQKGVSQALIVFGVWAFVSGLVQLILGISRRKKLGGQWPLIISGGQSMLAGISFIAMANSPTMGVSSLAGYSAFGAFYFLLSAIRLSKTIKNLEKAV
ncbi:hypothetical protein EOD41_05335 [Mucilaginibacter limnophilus]|uniref:DUF308 domain-containing protein n=1 Tax=Mucilaginibacter limnophilus TaxID=1932778 RepID=A0A437MUP5_9SPHI|nr:DUF308 domain-containing protein [Mucilaginibacter limnophilus]RVU01388.1 hypothetical protein EOD41_05335 [Mucilaginibacter limnophilus]